MATKKSNKNNISDCVCRGMAAFSEILKFKSPGAIRKFLVAKKCKGARADETSCPIANYVKKESGIEDGIYVSGSSLKISQLIGNTDVNIEFSANKAVEEFVANFDHGKYKELNDGSNEDEDEDDNSDYIVD